VALFSTMPPSRKRRQSERSSTEAPVPRQTIPLHSTNQATSSNNESSWALLKDYKLLEAWIQHDDVSFHYFDEDEALQIRDKLQIWYRQHRRKLPWRGDPPPWQGSTVNFADKTKQGKPTSSAASKGTTSSIGMANQTDDVDSPLYRTYPVTAYGVWVSEIMLQQTRVEAVVAKWCQWMTAFPTVEALAAATPDQVNAHWAGLGFYRRARLLHAAAIQTVVPTTTTTQPPPGPPLPLLPDTVAAWQALPGVGRYTASAVASIANNVTVPVVDGNVCRVLARLRGVSQTIKATSFKDKHGWDLAGQIVGTADTAQTRLDGPCVAGDGGGAGAVNQALMELGATYCAPSGTGTDPNDPLYEFYWSTRLAREAADYCRRGGNLNEIIQSLQEQPRDKTCCQLCADQGVARVLQNLNTLLSETMVDNEDCAKFGHAVFPLAPPKVHKREDVLAVAAISCGDAWLLVKRPEDGGLLSGQWEFPAVIVWSSESDSGKKKNQRQDQSQAVPRVATSIRRTAIRKLLRDTVASSPVSPLLCEISLHAVGKDPIEHIFSHVRHTMWVDHAVVEADDTIIDRYNTSSNVQWMNAAEMQKVGITSGFQKVLKAVHQERTKSAPKPLKRSKKS
jgi:A/G-specific adenine glycosylase